MSSASTPPAATRAWSAAFGYFERPSGIAVDPLAGTIFVSDEDATASLNGRRHPRRSHRG